MNIIDYLKPSMPEYLQEQIKRIQQNIIQGSWTQIEKYLEQINIIII